MNPVILSCTTLLKCVEAAQKKCGTALPVIELDRRYHNDPSQMREHILDTLKRLPKETDTVLAAMGFCGGSWQDVTSEKTIVIPKAADCIALELASPEQYLPDLKEPGHMYLFGEGENGFSVSAIYDELLKKYDREMANIVFQMYFEHYRHLDIIDNGMYDCYDVKYVEKAQAEADMINAELDFVPGSNMLLEKLVSGVWDEQFVVVPPGKKITQGMFYDG